MALVVMILLAMVVWLLFEFVDVVMKTLLIVDLAMLRGGKEGRF